MLSTITKVPMRSRTGINPPTDTILRFCVGKFNKDMPDTMKYILVNTCYLFNKTWGVPSEICPLPPIKKPIRYFSKIATFHFCLNLFNTHTHLLTNIRKIFGTPVLENGSALLRKWLRWPIVHAVLLHFSYISVALAIPHTVVLRRLSCVSLKQWLSIISTASSKLELTTA